MTRFRPRLPLRALVAAPLLCLAAAVPVAGAGPALAMLLESGRWELRPREGRGAVEQLCIADARRFIQLRHPAAHCDRLVVSDGPSEVTVQYTCPGRGYGRTSIRYETGRLMQLRSQGIVDGLPFDFAAEGRRVGECRA
jgi:hypothetical protein